MNKARVLALAIAAITVLWGCTSNAPTNAGQPVVPPATQGDQVATATNQQPAKPAHDCVTTELSQLYLEDTVRLAFGEGDTYLHYCFVSGYQGIGCEDNWQITRALGHGLSNRERAKCDAIMRRLERRQAAEDAREKRLDEAYDKQHGLQPAK